MPDRDTATDQFDRIVSMVATLLRDGDRALDDPYGYRGMSLDEVARELQSTPQQVLRGVRVLTAAAENDAHGAWQSLYVGQDGDRIVLSNMDLFRRPIRLTHEEHLALKVALLPEGDRLSEGLRDFIGIAEADSTMLEAAPFIQGDEAVVVDLMRTAGALNRKVRITYTSGEEDDEPSSRVIHPYEVISASGHFYIVAWCEARRDWRTRFRADRVLDAELLDDMYERRDDVPATESREQLFAEPDDADDVTVRFTPNVARWIAERYPSHVQHDDGSIEITFQVASTDWLVGNVLQYGPDAEVVGPPAYREAVRRAVVG